MAYHHHNAVVGVSKSQSVQLLERVFSSIKDAPLLDALSGEVRRGPKGYPVKILWRCVLTRYVLGIPSTAALIRTLQNSPAIAEVCGIHDISEIPNPSTLSRFASRLAWEQYRKHVKGISRELVRRHYATLPGFGDRVALDSTTLKAWANGRHGKRVDAEAGWSVKRGTQTKIEYTYGWKLHVLVDTETEMPISANVSRGNENDHARAPRVLSEARFTYSKFYPKFLMADKGYAGRPLSRIIKQQYGASPIIDLPKNYASLQAEFGVKMARPEWKALYAQRTAVERVFARLKGQHSLNHIRTRGLRRVTVHCYLSLIALQAKFVLPVADEFQLPLL